MRKFISRAAALLLAGVMTAAVAGCGKNSDSEAKDTAKKWTELDQNQITEAMGLGWNLGNQLEASSGGLPSETCWGNPEVTKELIDTVKAQGFKTVRIPVSYLDMIGDGPDYKIDTDWLDRVQEVVDYVVNNDMFAIVNMHGDGYYTVDHSWLLCAEDDDKQTEIKDKYGKVWTQIADRFKDYAQ
ncbi:glycoside hydrolase family 5 protein, partial [Ruminococcus sp.]|uniref:glycoside hydrolase family 5 protein n=1 Tax=Ruminococcus sp. TaxID=41978 RepID=UPI003FD83E70